MSARPLDNAAPTIYAPAAEASSSRRKSGKAMLWDDADLDGYEEEAGSASDMSDGEAREEIDAEEVYGARDFDLLQEQIFDEAFKSNSDMPDLLRSITDPEHPVSLEQLRVVNPDDIKVSGNRVLVYLTPTIPHCSMSTLIGLSLRVRLMRALPPRFRVDIRIKEGTHQSEHAVNKQLNDKERVQAALENQHLLQVVEGCLATAGRRGKAVDDGHGHAH